MTHLIIYINSEQKASAYYRIDKENASSISFNGNEYETDLSQFCIIVMEELRVSSLNEMGKRGGISVLIVSNGATNENIRKILGHLLHDENEDGVLNVNIQELNIIEAKYILSLIGNPAEPCAEDFLKLFLLENNSFVERKEFDKLKSINDKLENEISEYKNNQEKIQKENLELRAFKNFVIDNIGKKYEQKESIHKTDFINDPQLSIDSKFFPKDSDKVQFHSSINLKNGQNVLSGATIGMYDSCLYGSAKSKTDERGRTVIAKRNGTIFYLVADNQLVSNGEPIAVVGDFNSLEEAKEFVKNS